MEYKNLKFQVKKLSDEGVFEGYAAVKNNVDSYGDIIENGAFKRTITNQKKFPILFMHNPSQPVGISLSMKEDPHGLYTCGKLDLSTELGRTVHSGLKMGYIDSMSIGYKVVKDSMNKKGNRLLKEIKLMEYSMITKGFAANELALVSNFKSSADLELLLKRIDDFEKTLQERDENLLAKQDYMDDDMMDEDYIVDEDMDDDGDIDDDDQRLFEEMIEHVASLHDKLMILKERVENKGSKPKTCNCDDEDMGDSPKMALAHMTDSLEDTLSFESKAVIGDMSLPLAPKSKPWNGPAAEKRIFKWAGGTSFDPAKAKKAFFYVDSAQATNRNSYKLPFADVVGGKLVAIPRAISAVKGALDGARGGVDIPSADKAKIMKRVEAYEKRMGKDAVPKEEVPKADLSALLRDMKNFARSVK